MSAKLISKMQVNLNSDFVLEKYLADWLFHSDTLLPSVATGIKT